MRVVRVEDVRWTPLENSHRDGGLEFKNILEGVEGTPENYWLSLAKGDGRFFSPRHRHNFDQFRMCIEGRTNIDPKKFLEPGQIGYFPEGTRYGPQQDTGPNVTLVLQFGAASGGGFLSRGQLRRALDELRAMGEFQGGVFTRAGATGRKNQDGFEAVWEHVMGRDLTYPEPRYESPVFLNIENFAWRPTATEGVKRKILGVFTERETRLELVGLDAGATWTSPEEDAIGITFVLAGNGTAAGREYQRHTSIELISGERATFEAAGTTELLRMILPTLSSEGAAFEMRPKAQVLAAE